MIKLKQLIPPITIISIMVLGAALTVNTNSNNQLVLGHGDPKTLTGVYDLWRTQYEANGGSATTLRLPLAHSKALSNIDSTARGYMALDLLTGAISVKAKGLGQQAYEVWLVDNREGNNRTVKPEQGDAFFRLGTLEHGPDMAVLDAQIDRMALADFKIDLVAITPKGKTPDQSMVLVGAPDLMQSLYYSSNPWSQANMGNLKVKVASSSPFAFLLPKLALAASPNGNQTDLAAVMGAEIAEGRRIFINETFNGNGRTCSTCHRLDNNHTLDPKYIAKLPKSDPLFVAETNPALKVGFENPKLMRELGLILANIDGFDKPGVMRSIPHTLGLSKTMTTELRSNGGEFALDENFANALGWSGDGSVGTGSLREFAIGAVAQHFPKTMARTQGVDFRFPTDAELNALQAYMLSLGRSDELTLSKMTFKSNIVQRGKVLFDQKQNPVDTTGKPILGTSANCNGCHSNAGAISSTTGGNPTRDTGAELMADQPAVLLEPTVPMDGGIGNQDVLGWCSDNDPSTPCSYGEGRFNTPSLIEAADTAPFFHNNSVNSIEEAVAFYNTDAFNNSPGHLTSSKKDRTVKISSSQVVAVSLFLRTVNALENIRNSNKLDDQAINLNISNGKDIVQLALADTEDAIQVLNEGQLLPYPEAVSKLQDAYKLEYAASLAPVPVLRNPLLNKAKALKLEADALMVTRTP